MSKSKVERTTIFRWNTRFELYSYFKEKHNLGRSEIDKEITRVIHTFKPRIAKPIITKELWQKVGLNLEAILGIQPENEQNQPS
jgi:hypothetical protein